MIDVSGTIPVSFIRILIMGTEFVPQKSILRILRPERPRHRWGITLRWILEGQDGVMWTGFIWLKMETSGGFL
jgi:hypothetical protein